MQYQFLGSFDDNVYVVKNPHLSFSFSNIILFLKKPYYAMYIPLTMLSYMFDFNLWGLNSFGYHLQNVFWHIVATIAIYKCFRLFKIKSWIAFFLCLIFAVHPQRIESVVWISERKDVLCAAFYFLSIFFYVKNSNGKFSITAFIFFILAILSKPMAISLPFVLVLYEFYRSNKDNRLETVDCRLKAGWKGTVVGEKERAVGCQLSVVSERKDVISDPLSVVSEQKKENKNRLLNKKNCLSTKDTKLKNKNSVFSVVNPIRVLRVFRGQIFRAFSVFRGKDFRAISEIRGYIFTLWPYFLIILIFIPISIATQSNAGAIRANNHFFSVSRLYTILYNIYWYFKQAFFPIELNPFYPHHILFNGTIELLFFYLGSILLIVVTLKQNLIFFVYVILPLLLTFIVSLLPVIGIISLGAVTHADRWSYIPSAFIWFSIGLLITKLLYCRNTKNQEFLTKRKGSFLRNRITVFILLLFYTIILTTKTFLYQETWVDLYTLFSHASNSPRPNVNLLCILGDMAIEKCDYNRLQIIAKKLDQQRRNNVLAAFYKASFFYYTDRERAISLLIKLRPTFKVAANTNQDLFSHYYKTLKMLINSYTSLGYKHNAEKYVDELLKYERISKLDRYFFHGMKAEYLDDYTKAISCYNKALKFATGNQNIKSRIERCKKLQKKEID